ncbi:MAG: glycosyltransferase [Ruminococcaceae bacterium]|nr:glycosyltransferase [Oscillospiraceae bacterium]
MSTPRVSVIINTYNRGQHVKRLLDCLSRQTYENFEVIVVNGPSTDNTDEVLAQYASAIRVGRCPEVNLCVSRNIGVRMAAGEILAFIDDDAVPGDEYWLENAVPYFEEPQVAVLGGTVHRIFGPEFRYGIFSIFGQNNRTVLPMPIPEKDMEPGWYRHGMGCNFFLRRSAVMEVGGFDLYYAYYLDETDLCLRLQQAGHRVEYSRRVTVLHEAAKADYRKTPYHLNWDTIARSRAYFVVKATEGFGLTMEERCAKAAESCEEWPRKFDEYLKHKYITNEDHRQFMALVEQGMEEGLRDGASLARRLDYAIPYEPENFLPYNKSIGLSHLNICYFCQDDVQKPVGGSATHTKALAKGLTAMGHNVYVITRAPEIGMFMSDGITICSAVCKEISAPGMENLTNAGSLLNFSVAAYEKLQQIKKSFGIQVLESPIWDTNGVVSVCMEKDIPLAVRLQTPLKMVLETFQSEENRDFAQIMEFEALLMDRADQIIAISDCVRHTIEELYDMDFGDRVEKNYLGISSETTAQRSRGEDGKLVVFFIGRLERRKGIDSILAAAPALLEKYPTLEFRLAGDNEAVDGVLGDTYKNDFLRRHAQAPWLERVKFMGRISEEEKEQEFADCDVFVSPSLYESFGIIFIEAMRYGTPVIGCRSGGMPEVIGDGEAGLLCEPGDAADFEHCLDRLLADPALRRKLGEQGRQRQRTLFSEESMCRGSEAIYRKMIEKGRKP